MSGALDVLVHAAGTIDFGAVAVAPVDQLDRMVSINLRAPYVLTQALLPLLRHSRGHIVFINSSAGLRPSGGVAAYGATKHALRGLADALRDEVNPFGIRVTSVYPGRTRTPLQASVYRWEGRDDPPAGLLEPADIASMVVALVSLPQGAEVTDLHIRPASPPASRRDAPSEGSVEPGRSDIT
jgi:NAD(P)-dependent dehydrogenase (short-subunit alcohol dehydrogenase family)